MPSLHLDSSQESDMCSPKPVRDRDLQQNICWQRGEEPGPRLVNLWALVGLLMMSHLVGCFRLWSGSAPRAGLTLTVAASVFHEDK